MRPRQSRISNHISRVKLLRPSSPTNVSNTLIQIWMEHFHKGSQLLSLTLQKDGECLHHLGVLICVMVQWSHARSSMQSITSTAPSATRRAAPPPKKNQQVQEDRSHWSNAALGLFPPALSCSRKRETHVHLIMLSVRFQVYDYTCCRKHVCLKACLCHVVVCQWSSSWRLCRATHGLPCSGTGDPPVCHRVQGDSVAKRQPFFVWVWVLLES